VQADHATEGVPENDRAAGVDQVRHGLGDRGQLAAIWVEDAAVTRWLTSSRSAASWTPRWVDKTSFNDLQANLIVLGPLIASAAAAFLQS
jgi:hypothetical protein